MKPWMIVTLFLFCTFVITPLLAALPLEILFPIDTGLLTVVIILCIIAWIRTYKGKPR
jgi:predicted Na+-dependent transporter